MKRLIVSAATIVVLVSALASGQSRTVRIAFDDGKVTLAATDAPVADVLAAWAAVGGTVITGLENVPADRITVAFTAVSELTVLDDLLGSSGGYLTGMRSEVLPGTSLLRMIQIGKRSKESAPVKASRVIDMSIPESQFQYADPSPDFPDPRESADPSPAPAPSGPQIMPEMRFQYAETPMPSPPEVPEEPQDKPAADPNPAPKKKATTLKSVVSRVRQLARTFQGSPRAPWYGTTLEVSEMSVNAMVGRLVCTAALVLAVAGVAEAQATRTWVSGVGDDVNPCSRTAPCKTFAGAISKTATNGYIHVLDPGAFGAVTITKNITIDGTPFMAGVLGTLATNGIIINGAGIKVTLRGLDIEGASTGGNGVRILNAATVNIENCHITDWATAAIEANFSGLLTVADTEIKRSTIGINVTGARAMVENVHSDFNTTGMKANANAQITVRNSYLTGGGEGFNVAQASSIINVENSVIQANTFGVNAQNGTIRISNSGILSNSNTGLFNAGAAQIISLSGNTLEGNPTPGAFTSTILKK